MHRRGHAPRALEGVDALAHVGARVETLVLTQASDPIRADDLPPGARSARPVVLRRPRSIIPGFGLTLGLTLAWLSLIVLLPLVALFARAAALDGSRFIETVTSASGIP